MSRANKQEDAARSAQSAEDERLLHKISEISGRINRHKNPADILRSQPWNKLTTQSPELSWRNTRATPYARQQGRASKPTGHRHRTLVVNSSNNTSSNDEENSKQLGSGWISKRDRHMQLINTTVYDKETQVRSKAMAETRRQKTLAKDLKEKEKIQRFLVAANVQQIGAEVPPPAHDVLVDGIRFRVMNRGSKLARIRGEPIRIKDTNRPGSTITGQADSATATPKQATIGGVTFLRSKNGNLYRSGIVRAKKNSGASEKIDQACKRFTSTGRCLKGPGCPYIHDATKVAMCRDFLQTGTCPAGNSCDLSHDPSPERVPACLHFLRGKCSKTSCRYAHVRVNPSAPVCRDFAILGYCEKGATCLDRHIHECPDYANTGTCRKARCPLPHVDRAGQIRKQAADKVEDPTTNYYDDIVSEDEAEMNSDDMDSDGVEEILGADPSDDASHAMSQQQDFVGF